MFRYALLPEKTALTKLEFKGEVPVPSEDDGTEAGGGSTEDTDGEDGGVTEDPLT